MSKKIIDWLLELKPEHRYKAIKYHCEYALINYTDVVLDVNVKNSLYRALFGAFVFQDTDEGHEYWSKICKSINNGTYFEKNMEDNLKVGDYLTVEKDAGLGIIKGKKYKIIGKAAVYTIEIENGTTIDITSNGSMSNLQFIKNKKHNYE